MVGREDKNPWTKFYWQDFDSDTVLRLCSLAAQGLWRRMLSLMAKSNKKGFLLENEKQMESKSLAKLVGVSVEEIEPLIGELEHYGVFSRDSLGVIYNRRMKRESELSKIRAKAGAKGGRPKKQMESKSKSKTKARSAYASAYASSSASVYNKNKDKKSSKYKYQKKHFNEAKYLESAIKETNPKYTIRGKEYLEDWASTFRIMEEKKEASLEEIRLMINFAMGDPFWHSNILSAAKLREQFGRLWEQAKEKKKVKSDLRTGQRTSEQSPEEEKYWKARKAKERELKKQNKSEDEVNNILASWSKLYWEGKKCD